MADLASGSSLNRRKRRKVLFPCENNNIETDEELTFKKYHIKSLQLYVNYFIINGIKIRTVLVVTAVLLFGCSVGIFSRPALPKYFLNFLLSSMGLHYENSDSGNSNKIKLGLFSDKISSIGSKILYNEGHGCPENFDKYTTQDVNNNKEWRTKNNNCGQTSPNSDTFYDTSISVRYKQRFTASKDVKREAVSAMNIALDLQNRGKTDKAMKVFQHALALDPSHADILTAFGEFLEWHVHDIVKADHMYHIALENSPEHSRALQNRKRTAPIVEEIDQARFNRVDQKRTQLYTIPHNHPGLRRAKREAYFAHIYHTNAIEGNTLTLAQTRSIVETRLAVGGKSLREQNEVLGLDSALSYINSTLVGRVGRLTLQDILDVHMRVLGHVDPLEAGIFRTTQVYVGDFTPPPACDLREHMNQLIEWLNSEEGLALHPIEFAALAHYRLVAIHPFYDGNGRTSRLLMNLILMQAGFPPVSIEVSDRLTYYETLQQANDGDIRPFIRFISKCAERTLDEYLSVTSEESDVILPSTIHRNKFKPSERIIVSDSDFDDESDLEDSDNSNIYDSIDKKRDYLHNKS